MKLNVCVLAAIPMLLRASIASAQQYPILDAVATKVIEKYQNATCEQLWQERAKGQSQPKPEREQRAIAMLKQDPSMRAAFLDKVAGPIANKMFTCGMIP